VKLKDIVEYVRNGKSIKNSSDGVGLPITRIETISDGSFNQEKLGYGGVKDLTKIGDYWLRNGDILMSHINSPKHLGKSAIFKHNGLDVIHGMNLLCIRPKKEEVIPEYLNYYFISRDFDSYIKSISNQSVNQASFAASKLKKLEIPLPSLSEQKAIVAKLDRAQRLIDIDREMLAKYDELIQSVFLEMFGDPVRNEKGWEVKKLGKVCNKITDGTHHSPDTFEDEEFPYITAKHVDPFKVDFYSKPSYVKKEDHEKIYSRCNPEKGDVLLIKDGATTGKAAINPYDFEFSMLSSLALLKLDVSQLRGNYLINVLNDERYKDLIRQKYMSGVAIKRYTLKKINQFEIPIPDVALQNRFDEIVEKIDVEKQETLESSKKSEELFSSLVQGVFG